MKRFAAFLVILGVWAALTLLGGCRIGNLATGLQVEQPRDDHVDVISPQDEHYLGRGVSAKILTRHKPLQAPGSNAYVNKLCQALVLLSPGGDSYGGYYAQILDTREAVSFAAPGGFIFISRGMLQHISCESELAAMLAREIAHVQNRHALKGLFRAQIEEAYAQSHLAAERGRKNAPSEEMARIFGACVDDLAFVLMDRGYSEVQERRANEDAAAILLEAGYDPAALDSLLDNLDRASGISRANATPRGKNSGPPDEPPARAKRFNAALGRYTNISR